MDVSVDAAFPCCFVVVNDVTNTRWQHLCVPETTLSEAEIHHLCFSVLHG